MLSLLQLLLPSAFFLGDETPGFRAYQQQTRDRWESLYSKLLPSHVKYREEAGANICEFVGYPEEGQTSAVHFQGSPIEADVDPVKIKEYVEALGSRYGGVSGLSFKVLKGWTSPQFYQVLESFGFADVELSTIMSLSNLSELLPQRPLADSYRLERITDDYEKLLNFGRIHGTTCQWITDRFDPSVVFDRRLGFWQAIHEPSGTVACTALIECVNGVAGLHMVETMMEHRRKGLASALLHNALSEVFREHSPSHVVLGSTPEAVALYERLGFKSHGQYHSYDYLDQQDRRVMFSRKRLSDIIR